MPSDAGDLWALTYVSRATSRLAEPQIKNLLDDARAHNESVGITGFLAYETDGEEDAGVFVQRIEGARADVRAVFDDRIVPSRLHHEVEVVWEGDIPYRSYLAWSMAYGRWLGGTRETTTDLVRRLSGPVVASPLTPS